MYAVQNGLNDFFDYLNNRKRKIKKIDNIVPLENSDNLNIAIIGGWKIVINTLVKKQANFLWYLLSII